MTEKRQEKSNSKNEQVRDFVSRISNEHKMLVVLKKQLYGGNWQDMLEDLENRLQGKPYVFKLVNRINDDIQRIKELMEFEEDNGVDLSEFVEL
jgi:hypothetical protein